MLSPATNFPLNDVDHCLIVVDHDGVDLLVVCTVCSIVARFVHIPSQDIAQIPGYEPLTVICEILLKVGRRDFAS